MSFDSFSYPALEPTYKTLHSQMRNFTWVSRVLSSETLALREASGKFSAPSTEAGARNLLKTEPTEGCPKEKALLPGEKTITAISAPQSVASSLAFLKSPWRRLEKVTCRLNSLEILTIGNFWRPLVFFFTVEAIKEVGSTH